MKFKAITGVVLTMLRVGMIAFVYAEEYFFILKWGSLGSGNGQFDEPYGVAVDGSGNVYVTDVLNDRVQKFGVPAPSVGGVWVPVDKLSLLAPYVALASTILVATAAIAIYVKHAKRRKKKQ